MLKGDRPMATAPHGRPTADEHAPYFAGYVARVPDGDILEILERQSGALRALLAPLSRAQLLARPKPEDWNALEVLGHITDGEQVFAYRALHIARGDATPLPSFDQDDYVAAARSSERTIEDLLDAHEAQRRATIAMLRGLPADAWLRRGEASGRPSTPRAWAYIAAGHELHHIADFRERYGF
jgi:hypothetical protein